jgi:hypothetical protein
MINRIGILVRALSARLRPRRKQEGWIAETEPLERQYRAVAVLSVAAFGSGTGGVDTGAVARALLKQGFEMTRPNEWIYLPGAPLRTVPGDALIGIPDIASWFSQTWSAIRFEHERAWPNRAHRALGANPAEIMGLWGLGIIESLAADLTRRDDLRTMWLTLEIVLREARLIEARMGKDFWCQAVARLFAWWPHAFEFQSAQKVDGTPSPIAVTLGDVLAPYVGIDNDFMAIVVSLYEKGIDVPTLDDAVGRSEKDLLRMIRRFVEPTRGLKDVRLWNQGWVVVLTRIETLLGAQQRRAAVDRDAGHRA